VLPVDDHSDDDGRTPAQSAWPWLLVAAAALPAVLAGDVSRRILGGALDASYGGGFDSAGSQPVSLTQRWELLQFTASPESGALTSALALVVVAAVVLAGRPAALVPGRPARWLAVAVGAATALVGLGSLVGMLVYAGRDVPPPEQGGNYGGTPDYLTLAPRVGVAVLAVVLAVFATVVVLRPRARADQGTEDGPVDAAVPRTAPAAAEPAVAEPTPAEPALAGPTAAEPADTAVADTAVAETAVAGTAPRAPAPPRVVLPHLSEDELALYRRPRSTPATRS